MYKLVFTDNWLKRYKKLIGKNILLKKKVKHNLQKLGINPRYSVLHTHKVDTSDYGKCWSSRITGDLRVIWDYSDEKEGLIVLLDLGGHSGKGRVYK